VKVLKRFIISFILWYLKTASWVQLAKIRPTIIGVGGSSGKTSLCNFIALTLSGKYKIRQSKGKNSETGIPLNILGLEISDYTLLNWIKILFIIPIKLLFDWSKYDFYIAEMGIDSPFKPKNMSYLLELIQPKFGILTNISLEHTEYFDVLVKKEGKSRSEALLKLTAEEELLLLKSIPKNGIAVINLDDSYIRDSIKDIKAERITVSKFNKNADYFIDRVESTISQSRLYFTHNNSSYRIVSPSPLPEYYAYSLVFSIALGSLLGIEINQSIKSLEKNFSLPPGRFSIFKGIKNTLLIDSSYNNATLPTILEILSFIKRIASKKRKVGIIGDMRELGTTSQEQHKILANKIAETMDFSILIGPLMQKFVAPILEEKNFQFKSFETFTKARVYIKESIKTGDLILVKGSQNTLFLERAVEMLLKNPKDKNKLCRRGAFWDRLRSKAP
jgi:UDP-N-acetylmuramoyl-tripeptide--D-alanyl-D-alanine ligase